MKLKRVLSGVIGFPIVALIFIYGNKYIIDAFIGIISIMAMYEYLFINSIFTCNSERIFTNYYCSFNITNSGIAFYESDCK